MEADELDWHLNLSANSERKVRFDEADDVEREAQKWSRSELDIIRDCNLSLDDSVIEKLELSEFETLEREFEKLADSMKPKARTQQAQRSSTNVQVLAQHAVTRHDMQEDSSPRKSAPMRSAAVEIEANLEVEDESIGWLRTYGKLYANDGATKPRSEPVSLSLSQSKPSHPREDYESAHAPSPPSDELHDSPKKPRIATFRNEPTNSFSPPRARTAFDDDESWSTAASPRRRAALLDSPDGGVKDTKVKFELAKDRSTDSLSDAHRNQLFADLEPTSRLLGDENSQPKRSLVESLFASETDSATAECGTRTQQLSALLTEKLAQLETEIEKFRRENASLNRLKAERADQVRTLQRQAEQLERHKSELESNFSTAVRDEIARARRERKMYETMQTRLKTELERTADERRELESVRSELRTLREEARTADDRWQRSVARLQARCNELEAHNSKLQDEVATLERLRLANWGAQQPTNNTAHVPTVTKPAAKTLARAANGRVIDSELDCVRVSPSKERRREAPEPRQLVNRVHVNPDTHDVDGEVVEAAVDLLDGNANMKQVESNVYEALLTETLRASVIDQRIRTDSKSTKETQHADGRVERVFVDGSRELVYANGTRKEVSADERRYVIRFLNGDLKRVDSDGRVVYLYNEPRTLHTTFPDGLEMLHFPNGQTEVHYTNGSKEVRFSDGTVRYVSAGGVEETMLRDGTVVRVSPNGDKLIVAPNGQRELHTSAFKRRDYPDGTTKTVFSDGRQETRYSSGRVRVKDTHGNIIFDRKVQDTPSASSTQLVVP